MHKTTTHEEFSVDHIELSPRSRLFQPQVMGAGTKYVEGLISYIVRIAGEHSVTPMRMLKKIYAVQNPDIARVMYPSFFNQYSSTVNGLGKYAKLFVGDTESLTGASDLRHTTLLPLSDLLPSTGCGLLEGHPKWCPECLSEMLLVHGQSYRPLIWSLKLYRACTTHKMPLVDICPHCNRVQPFIMRFPDLSRCAYCYKGLNVRVAEEDVEFTGFDCWIFNALEDLVSNISALDQVASANSFSDFIRRVIKDCLKTNGASFCKQIGLNSWAIKGWLNKGEKPSLPQLLSVCYGMDILPSWIFLQGTSQFESDGCGLRKLPSAIMTRAERPLLTVSQKKVLNHAMKHYAEDLNHIRPLSEVADELDYSASCLRYWFPKFCDQISAKHAEHKRVAGSANQQAGIDMVEAIVNEFKANGEYISNRKVNNRLLQRGKTLAKPVLYQMFKQIRRSLT